MEWAIRAADFPSPDYTKLQNQVLVTLKVETRWVTVRAARVRVAAPAQLFLTKFNIHE